MATAQKALKYFESLVGLHEVPPGSNRTKIGEQYGLNGVAWCAETEYEVLDHVGVKQPLKTPSAHMMIQSYAPAHRLVPIFTDLKPGDLAGCNFTAAANTIPNIEHIVMVIDLERGAFRQIAGNTSPPNTGGSESNGDGIYIKTYSADFFCCGARPFYDHEDAPGHDKANVRFEIGIGDHGSDVRLWQQLLNEMVGAKLHADGIFGKKTRRATVLWQSKHDVKADGTVLPHTIHDLAEALRERRHNKKETKK